MAEITGEIENIDKLFSEINVNGETHQSENYVEKETPVYQPAPEPVEEEPQLPPSEPVFVEREIEDISSLFSEINVNDTPHEQENYVEQHLPVYQPAPEPQEEEPFNPPPSVIGQNVTGIDLNSILHPIKDDNIGQQIETLNQAMQAIQQRMTELNALIPSQASASNKLADKDYVGTQVEGAKDYTDTQVGALIDDTTTSSTKAYSSQKTQTELDGKNGTITINADGLTFGDTTSLILGGNNTTNPTSFVRRTASSLWNYIKTKIQSTILINTNSDIGGMWVVARDKVAIKTSDGSGASGQTYRPLLSVKTANSDWSVGNLSGHDELYFVNVTDVDYNRTNNDHKHCRMSPYGFLPWSFINEKETLLYTKVIHHTNGVDLIRQDFTELTSPIIPLKWEGMAYIPSANYAFQLVGDWTNNMGSSDWGMVSYLTIPTTITSTSKNSINIRLATSIKNYDFDIYLRLWYSLR